MRSPPWLDLPTWPLTTNHAMAPQRPRRHRGVRAGGALPLPGPHLRGAAEAGRAAPSVEPGGGGGGRPGTARPLQPKRQPSSPTFPRAAVYCGDMTTLSPPPGDRLFFYRTFPPHPTPLPEKNLDDFWPLFLSPFSPLSLFGPQGSD